MLYKQGRYFALSPEKIKIYFARMLLTLILFWGTWLALQPGYSLSPWMPYDLMRWLGFHYSALLWLDHNVALIMHFWIAIIGTVLLYYSRFSHPRLAISTIFRSQAGTTRLSPHVCALAFCTLALATELVQLIVGRGFELTDLLVGWLGIAIGFLIVRKK